MITTAREFKQLTENNLDQVSAFVVKEIDQTKIWVLHGDLGSGKTTLIKVIGEACGVDDAMSSPSFSIVNEYHSTRFGKFYHFDFYRIKSETEAVEIGLEEYFYSGYPCFIEWPEKIPSLIPSDRGEININFDDETHRTIAISVHDGEEENRV